MPESSAPTTLASLPWLFPPYPIDAAAIQADGGRAAAGKSDISLLFFTDQAHERATVRVKNLRKTQ